MLLRDWIVERSYTQEQFAVAIGYTRTHMSLILSKKRLPSFDFAEKVERMTEGAITIDNILDGSSLGRGDRRRRACKGGRPKKLLPKNAISFL